MRRGLHWFRNDLRLSDNSALRRAAAESETLSLVYVLDDGLWSSPATGAARQRFLLDCLTRLGAELERRDQRLIVRRGKPALEIPRLARELRADAVFFNRDTSPYARRRDEAVRHTLEREGARVVDCADRVVFEASELLTGRGEPYSVYTPYRRAWQERWRAHPPETPRAPRLPSPPPGAPASASLPESPASAAALELPTGGERAARRQLGRFAERDLGDYAERRDRPDLDGTSRLSAPLRFGALSPRSCVAIALEAARDDRRLRPGAAKWVDELIWRDFYAGILEQHPRVLREALRPEFAELRWNEDESGFQAWCQGRTGFPIVDAGMRQLLATGWMHNRLRMITASFLCKDLWIDWRRGERFFFQQLVDGDPASNCGGWQWAASVGTDAQPYFRIFNPTSQGRKCDPEGRFVKRWLPELRDLPPAIAHEPWKSPGLAPDYPAPIVNHAERREQALRRFEAARSRSTRSRSTRSRD